MRKILLSLDGHIDDINKVADVIRQPNNLEEIMLVVDVLTKPTHLQQLFSAIEDHNNNTHAIQITRVIVRVQSKTPQYIFESPCKYDKFSLGMRADPTQGIRTEVKPSTA